MTLSPARSGRALLRVLSSCVSLNKQMAYSLCLFLLSCTLASRTSADLLPPCLSVCYSTLPVIIVTSSKSWLIFSVVSPCRSSAIFWVRLFQFSGSVTRSLLRYHLSYHHQPLWAVQVVDTSDYWRTYSNHAGKKTEKQKHNRWFSDFSLQPSTYAHVPMRM